MEAGDNVAASEPPAALQPLAEFRDSRLFFGTIAALNAAVALAATPVPALFFGACAIWWARNVIAPRTRIRVTREGVELSYFVRSPGLIRWEDVVDVREGRFGTVEVELKDEDGFARRLSLPDRLVAGLNRLFYGFGPTAVSGLMVAGSRKEIHAALEAALDAYTLEASRESLLLKGE